MKTDVHDRPGIVSTAAVGACEPDIEQLFRQLFDAHHVRLQRFILRRIGHPDEADELAQQTFCEAARAIGRFRGESELSTWLYGIALNLCRNHLGRSPSRRFRFTSDEALDMAVEPGPDPGDIVSGRQELRQLSECMAALPREMQEVLHLVAIEESSYDEAANVLSVPVGTVRSRLSRARATLRSRLAGNALNGADPAETAADCHRRRC